MDPCKKITKKKVSQKNALGINWAAPLRNVSSGACEQRRPRSACAFAQSDQGLHCSLTELLDTTEYMTGEQMPGLHFAHAQGDLNLRILRMF